MIKFNPMGPSLLDGPPGSDPWNEAVCRSLQLTVEDKDRYRRKDLWDNMQRVYDHEVWNLFPPENPVGIKKFSEEITGKPWDWILSELKAVGAKTLVENLEKAVFRDLERFEVGENGGDRKSCQFDKKLDVKLKPTDKGGNSSAYRAAKLKRDYPEVHARLIAGEFKNVAEAERTAGVGRPIMSQLDRVLAAFQRLSPDDREKFMELAGSMMESA